MKNALVEYLDYQKPVTQLKGQKGNGGMQAAKLSVNNGWGSFWGDCGGVTLPAHHRTQSIIRPHRLRLRNN